MMTQGKYICERFFSKRDRFTYFIISIGYNSLELAEPNEPRRFCNRSNYHIIKMIIDSSQFKNVPFAYNYLRFH